MKITFFVLSILLFFAGSVKPTAAEIVKQVDANGKITYTNMAPQMVKKKVNKTNSAVSAYYDFSEALKGEYQVIKGRKKATKAGIELCTTSAHALNDQISPFADESITGSRAQKITALQGVVAVLSTESDIAKQRGQLDKRLLLSLKGQYCSGLSMLLLAEDHFEKRGIDHTKQKLNDGVCFENSTKSEAMAEHFKSDSVYSQKSTIASFCKKKWVTDYEMIEYCIENQTKALRTLQNYGGAILYRCSEKWKNDFEMVEYCTENQTAAKNRLGN